MGGPEGAAATSPGLWALTDASTFFWVDRAELRAELRVEGTYILQTNDPTLDVHQAVAAYKELQTVERGFRCLKDVLALRPIYHRTEPRVRAHLFVAHLALVLGVALEKALQRAGLALSLDTALEALRPVRTAAGSIPLASRASPLAYLWSYYPTTRSRRLPSPKLSSTPRLKATDVPLATARQFCPISCQGTPLQFTKR